MTPLLRSLLLLAGSGGIPSKLWESFKREGLPPEALYQEGEPLWRRLGYPGNIQDSLRRLSDGRWPEMEGERAARMGAVLVTCGDGDFPQGLRNHPDAPLLLYIRGKWPLPGTPVAVVGTRRCTTYGARTSAGIARALSEASCAVISGGAYGIDRAAHEGCLSAGGATAAVLGTGVDVPYPRGHCHLFRRIVESGGALVSEYPMGTTPLPWRFPRRNRIIAWWSERLVVVEAPLKSGAMITARHALEAGREVWAVPGRINEDGCAGSNRLIYDGAVPFVAMGDFVSLSLGRQISLFEDLKRTGRQNSCVFPEKEQIILALLKKSGERTVDNLAVEGTMSPAEVFSCLAALASAGKVFQAGPGRWSAVPE